MLCTITFFLLLIFEICFPLAFFLKWQKMVPSQLKLVQDDYRSAFQWNRLIEFYNHLINGCNHFYQRFLIIGCNRLISVLKRFNQFLINFCNLMQRDSMQILTKFWPSDQSVTTIVLYFIIIIHNHIYHYNNILLYILLW